MRRVDHLRAHVLKSQFLEPIFNDRGAAEEDGVGDALLDDLMAGAQHFVVLALGEDDALGRSLSALAHVLHDFVGAAQAAGQFIAVGGEIDLNLRHTRAHGGFRHRGRHPNQRARDRRAWG